MLFSTYIDVVGCFTIAARAPQKNARRPTGASYDFLNRQLGPADP